VGADKRFTRMDPRELRLELEALYADYAACLDEERFEEWPDFFNAPRSRDKLAVEDGRLRFQERICVFDSLLVPNSLIFPL